jgi:hypothetical protein
MENPPTVRLPDAITEAIPAGMTVNVDPDKSTTFAFVVLTWS